MNFKQIVPTDYPYYKKYFVNQKYRLCAYSLSSIIAWTNKSYMPLAAEIDGAMVLGCEFVKDTANRHMILPISPERDFSPEELKDLAVEAGFDTFWFVPEAYIDQYGMDRVAACFNVRNHGAYDDYVYLKEDLAELKGNRYSKKRNLIRQFLREYDTDNRIVIEPMAPAFADECIDFLEQWCRERDCDADVESDLACEKAACINTLNHLDDFEVNGLLLRIDGKVSAFGVAAHLTDDMASLQYEKAFSHVKGLYQYFDKACAGQLFDGYTYINKESDMGIPGLAKAKKSYHPVMSVKSYKLILKP